MFWFILQLTNFVLVSLEKLLLSKDIHDYHFQSQGKTTIPGVNDGEELEQTHVSRCDKCCWDHLCEGMLL